MKLKLQGPIARDFFQALGGTLAMPQNALKPYSSYEGTL